MFQLESRGPREPKEDRREDKESLAPSSSSSGGVDPGGPRVFGSELLRGDHPPVSVRHDRPTGHPFFYEDGGNLRPYVRFIGLITEHEKPQRPVPPGVPRLVYGGCYRSLVGRSSSQGLNLNRSQFGGCSTKYNTLAGT